ncbi:MAG: peroxide stress protein YaaA [Lachnospiraceae bacterium]|nr:peroxide stress protein YaaA [Lachnospiraceae bacterium]
MKIILSPTKKMNVDTDSLDIQGMPVFIQQTEDTYITVTFGEMSDGRIITKGTYAKMARGEMVRFMAENCIEDPEDMKAFDRLGYLYRDDLSSETEYVFERIK